VRPLPEFGKEYSGYYDILYYNKDYEKECDYIEKLFRLFSTRKVVTVRDVACGTGRHAIAFADRGYDVHASDISEHMVKIARERFRQSPQASRLHLAVGDMRKLHGSRRFDAALCMFAALGYLSRTSDVLATLRAIRRRLNPRGLLVFDVWNGLAVLTVRPSITTKKIRRGGITLTRKATPKLDPLRNSCRVLYDISVTQQTGRMMRFQETHVMRYFYPQEIKDLLEFCGYDLLSLHPFLGIRRGVTSNDWNMTAVATKRPEHA